jgi:CBS domain-containing protein
MKIHELMTREVEVCRPTTDLAAVAMTMWRRNCGVVPVVDGAGRVLGVITDRDICMAAATRHRRPGELLARDVTSEGLFSVGANQDVLAALEIMRTQRVRRLPVVDDSERLQGIVSLSDIVVRLKAPTARPDVEPSLNAVLSTLQGICQPSASERSTTRREAVVAMHG